MRTLIDKLLNNTFLFLQPNPNDAIYEDNERTRKINAIVDEIWAKYDADGNGALDKEETWKLA